MNKKILKFGKMVALFLVAMSCSKDNSSKDEVLPHAEERISSITLENLPQSIKEKLKEQIATDVFLHLQEEVTIIENEDGIKTYSVGMKQGVEIQAVMKNQKTISFIKKSPCNKIYGGGASTFNTIIINNSGGGFGMPTYVNSVNHGDYIETSFTNLNDGKTSVTWTPNPYSPKFKNGNWRNNDGFFQAFFEGMWSGIKTLGNGIGSIGRDVKNLFKGKHCRCRPRTRRPAEGSPAYVYTTDFIQEKLCCDEEINFMMPTHFLQSMPKPISLTQDDCDCALQNNPFPFVFDESEYVLLREEDKALLDCACSKGNSTILLGMLNFDSNVISPKKVDAKFLSEACSFLKESNYTSEAFAFAKEAVIAKEKGGEVNFKERLILTSSFINNPRLKCIYKNFYRGNNTISQYLKNFLKDGPKGYLKISTADDFTTRFTKSKGATAVTVSPDGENIIEIAFNTDPKGINNVMNTSTILVGFSLIHEMVHAEIYRKLLELKDTPYLIRGIIGEAAWKELLDNMKNKFPDMYKVYSYYELNTNIPNESQHEYMAQKYVNAMAKALADFDRNKKNLDFYKNVGWLGLQNSETFKRVIWKNPKALEDYNNSLNKARNETKDCSN